ncbi:MAG: N-acetylmuramoyl-L-alanine amidase [Gammaproteobacteria bacterium]|nr:N-acetylmuramoyl-L-alanine amidase [Gammaproteobacteria bacterium]MBU1655000.1 N-acetylmuramoyl-L-alanine amidase [Gammaproteobacteria bacterium]MBU1960021.1 N-acetylmuramoyl-L-alanine amidase [Gammaproteobacteria bacterium]
MRIIIGLTLLVFSLAAEAAQVAVHAVRYWTAPDHIRLVLDTAGPVVHNLFSLDNPNRLVIDLENVRLDSRLSDPTVSNPYLKGLRSGVQNGKDLRLVLDLKQPVRPKSYVLPPSGGYGHRLVFDLFESQGGQPRQPVVTVEQSIKGGLRDVVIAVDAGHGGEDPGALGTRGVKEKDVTLAIARRLADRINREPGMKAVLVRDGDYFIPLRKRMSIARKHHADLFVSIHADAFQDKRARGSSVFTLSRKGASSEAARWLAERENSADLVGGVSLDNKDDVLASVLLDLSQTATIQASNDVAHQVFGELSRVGNTHGSRVQQAGFMVLKAPDIPSLLVETAFISNPDEERKLVDSTHQGRIAGALMNGIRDYFHASPPIDTKLAAMLRGKRQAATGGNYPTESNEPRLGQTEVDPSANGRQGQVTEREKPRFPFDG